MAAKREDYLCLSAMLRAREPKMLTADRAASMTEAASFEDAAKALTECGYPDMSQMDPAGIEAQLNLHRNEIFGELDRLCPDKEPVEAFRLKYDYHNAKTLIKAEAMGNDARPVMNASGRYAPERLMDDYNNDRLNSCTPVFAAAVRSAKQLLAESGNPQQADFVLDRAYFTELSDCAKSLACPFFTGYVSVLADVMNLRALVRTLRMGRSADFLAGALVPGGSVPVEKLLAAGEASAIADTVPYGPASKPAALAAEAVEGDGMTAFEKACDNTVMEYISGAGFVNYGPETVVAYLHAVENEITAVRMILTGRLSKVPGEVIRERLRDMYA